MDADTKDVLSSICSVLRDQTAQIDFLHHWVKQLLDEYYANLRERHASPASSNCRNADSEYCRDASRN